MFEVHNDTGFTRAQCEKLNAEFKQRYNAGEWKHKESKWEAFQAFSNEVYSIYYLNNVKSGNWPTGGHDENYSDEIYSIDYLNNVKSGKWPTGGHDET